ncbi:MAG: ABC transporter ATP-binding protein [Chloroflexota bacterium]
MTQAGIAIEATHLRKEYGEAVAVADLTVQVCEGEVFGFLGPNGAGKSTTVKMLLGLVRPTQGEAKLLGQPSHLPQTRAKAGFLPEHFRFHEWLKATEFLMFHGKLYGLSSQALKKRIPELLDLVGLTDKAQVRLSKFSKGMLQRVGLAQAMLNQPKVIFLDEPTSGLDPLGRRLVRDIIAKLKAEGTTVFLNSHLLGEVEISCDRVAFIKQGRVVQVDTMADLLNQTLEVVLRVDTLTPSLMTALGQVGQLQAPNGASVSVMVKDEGVVPDIAQIVFDQGAKLYELSPKQTSLEEMFINIIGDSEGDGR